ncbi:MAG: pilus assembly protein [Acidimicrobiales bacterium]|nr:pilus assembly protein [Acidimicrobiales bacterium]
MRRLRRSEDKGTALLESALVLPFLIFLAIGLAEIGFLVIDQMAISNAAREGARVGSAAGKYVDTVDPSINADTLILRSVEQAACNLEHGSLKTVTIYRADSAGDLPADPNLINIYEVPTSGNLNCTAAGSTALTCDNGCPWAPASRRNLDPFDDVGVLVEFDHDPITGIFPFTGPVALSDRAVMRIEPNTRG